MVFGPITKEICWCQQKHPRGSVCGCWTCPDCGRFYSCNPYPYIELKPLGDLSPDFFYPLPEPEYYI